jgi:hypothetical protein
MRRGKLEKCCTPLRRNRGFGVCVCHTIPTAKVRMPYTVCHLDSRRISGLERVFDVLIISGMILSAGERDATSLSIGLGLYVSHLQYLLPIRGSLRAPRHSTFLPSRLHPVLVLCHQHAASCTPHACCTRYLLRCSGRGRRMIAVMRKMNTMITALNQQHARCIWSPPTERAEQGYSFWPTPPDR